jgi:protocatechuate 3,4-dioxygenase beta subunit
MANAGSSDADEYYDVLGVTRQQTLDEIERAKEDRINEHKDAISKARRTGDNDLFKEAQQALDDIDEAWLWIQENHEPPGIDKDVTVAATTADPVVGDPVEFEVTSPDGSESDVTVFTDREDVPSKETGADGTVTFTFERAGTVTVTAPATGGHDDATTTVDVARAEVDLRFTRAPDTVEVRDPAEFEVVGDGEPLADVELAVDGREIATTSGSGRATHAFDDTGEKEVVATRPRDDRAEYVEATATVSVTEETVTLRADVQESTVSVGDTVTVTVTESDGTPVEGATVSTGEESDRTDGNGVARVTVPETTGPTIEVTKSAAPGENRVYEGVTLSPTVEKRQASLRIDRVDGELMEGSEITVVVIGEDGRGVEDATVTADGERATTDDQGAATLELDDHGTLTIEATKESPHTDYDPDTRTVTVAEFTRGLTFGTIPKNASPGDDVRVRVTDEQGRPVANAELRSSRQFESWYTDDDGWATVGIDNQVGVVRITAEKSGGDFDGATATETIHVIN